MTSDEDEYVQSYLNQNPHIDEFWVEEPYNRYGDRGYVDLVASWEPKGDDEPTFYEIVEVKSESALRQATGANEVIRQVKKMAANFIDGQRNNIVPTDTMNYRFRIDFIDSEYTREHLTENYRLYESIHDADTDLTPRICVNLVSKDGKELCQFQNLKQWLNEEGWQPPLDIRDPEAGAAISILNADLEPEDETFCYRHGVEKTGRKPLIHLGGGRYYTLKKGHRLFYCTKCIVETIACMDIDRTPGEIIRSWGGIEKSAIIMTLGDAWETEDMDDAFGGREMWVELDEPIDALDHVGDDLADNEGFVNRVKSTQERYKNKDIGGSG